MQGDDDLPVSVPLLPVYNADFPIIIEPLTGVIPIVSPAPSPAPSPRGGGSRSTQASPTSPSTTPSPSSSPASGTLQCKICKKKFASEATWKTHLTSQGHLKMVKSQSPSQASSSPLNYATGGRSQGSDDDSELGKALLLAQTARKVTLSDPDKAFKQFVQAAKLYGKNGYCRDAVMAYKSVVDIQTKMLVAKKKAAKFEGKDAQCMAIIGSKLDDAGFLTADAQGVYAKQFGLTDLSLTHHRYGYQAIKYNDKSIEAFINCVKCVLPLKLLSIKEPISREQLKLGIESVIPSILNVTRFVDLQRAASNPPITFAMEVAAILLEAGCFISFDGPSLQSVLLLQAASMFDPSLSTLSLQYQAWIYSSFGARWLASDCMVSLYSQSTNASDFIDALKLSLQCDDVSRVQNILKSTPEDLQSDNLVVALAEAYLSFDFDKLEELRWTRSGELTYETQQLVNKIRQRLTR